VVLYRAYEVGLRAPQAIVAALPPYAILALLSVPFAFAEPAKFMPSIDDRRTLRERSSGSPNSWIA
jgi:hypothetical protein